MPHPDASSLTADHDVEKFVPTTHLRRQTKHTPGKPEDGKSAAENQKKKEGGWRAESGKLHTDPGWPLRLVRRQTKHTPGGKSKDGKSAAENQKKKDSYPPGSGEKGEYPHEIGGGGGWFKSRVRRQTKHTKGPSRGTKPVVDKSKQKESDEHGNVKGLIGPNCPTCSWYKKQSDETGNLPGERAPPLRAAFAVKTNTPGKAQNLLLARVRGRWGNAGHRDEDTPSDPHHFCDPSGC